MMATAVSDSERIEMIEAEVQHLTPGPWFWIRDRDEIPTGRVVADNSHEGRYSTDLFMTVDYRKELAKPICTMANNIQWLLEMARKGVKKRV